MMPEFPALATSLLTQELEQRLTERLTDHQANFTTIWRPGLPLSGPYDAMLLPGTLSLTPQPVATLQSLLPNLKPGGLLLGWVLGAGSFPELHHTCPLAGFPAPPALPTVQDVGSLIQGLGLALPVIDRDLLTLTFPSWARLAHHLKTHQALLRPPHSGLVTPRRWQQLAMLYTAHHQGTGAKIPLTLELIFFTSTKAAANLPQAAKRGSGKVSLVKILHSPPSKSSCQ